MAKRDWGEIKRQYVEGVESKGERKFPTYAELAKKHGFAAKTIRTRAAREGWTTAKDNLAAKVAQERDEKRIQLLATAGAEFDSRCLDQANRVLAALADKFAKMVKRAGKGEVDALEAKRVADAMRVAQLVGKVALGEQAGDESLNVPVTAGDAQARITVRYERTPPGGM